MADDDTYGGGVSRTQAIVLTVHLAATMGMVGVIWFVQLVHYPLFDRADRAGFREFESAHRNRTTIVVGPLMIAEGLSALALFFDRPPRVSQLAVLLGLVLLAVVAASTVLLQIPMHDRLSGGFDAGAHQRLVRSNWVRTIGWSARGVLAATMVASALGPFT
jgi:hypothetical protein